MSSARPVRTVVSSGSKAMAAHYLPRVRPSYIDSNLAGDALLFFYRVSAVADQRESAQSTLASGEAQADDVPPAAPTDVVAIADEVDPEVELTWSAPLDRPHRRAADRA